MRNNTEPDTRNIRDHIEEYIRDTGEAHIEVRAGVAGVVFHHDTQEFIPFDDLALSRRLGFYLIGMFPDEESVSTNENPWTLRPVITDEPGWRPFALLDGDGDGFMLGEAWQVAEAAAALRLFLERGLLSEPLREDDDAFGASRWLSIHEAMEAAHAHDPDEYPLDDNLAARIRAAARRGTILGRVVGRRWQFHARHFRAWLMRHEPAQRGETDDSHHP